MPSECTQNANIETAMAQETCSICLDLFEQNDANIRQLNCNHCFHEKCTANLIAQNHNLCPICRVPFYNKPQKNIIEYMRPRVTGVQGVLGMTEVVEIGSHRIEEQYDIWNLLTMRIIEEERLAESINALAESIEIFTREITRGCPRIEQASGRASRTNSSSLQMRHNDQTNSNEINIQIFQFQCNTGAPENTRFQVPRQYRCSEKYKIPRQNWRSWKHR
jgi:hypothetical protein